MPLFGPPNIAALEAKRDTQGLIKALDFKDPSIRIAAADALGPLKDPQATEPLIGLLKDEHAGVRRSAVVALGARGGARVVEPLVQSLSDPDPDVRTATATAVYKRLMTDPDMDARRGTAAALGRVRDPYAVEPLIKAILDADETVRVASIKALASIGDTAAIVPLINVQAREQARQKATGRSSLAVERTAAQALDSLCSGEGVEPLKAVLKHSDPEVREVAVRRLSRMGTVEVTDALVEALADTDPVVRRSAARGLQEIGWKPDNGELGARYWTALREWAKAAECGAPSVPMLQGAFERADAAERADIVAALNQIGWKPDKSGLAAHYWAAQGKWEKCVEIGEPAVEPLESVLRSAPVWRDRVAASGALALMNHAHNWPFPRLDLVLKAIRIVDGAGSADERRDAAEKMLSEAGVLDTNAGQSVEPCQCGYPAIRIRSDGVREPFKEVLGFESGPGNAIVHYCPACGIRR